MRKKDTLKTGEGAQGKTQSLERESKMEARKGSWEARKVSSSQLEGRQVEWGERMESVDENRE